MNGGAGEVDLAPARKVYGVAELTRRIKDLLEEDIGEVWVEGEVSNLRQPASGHLYFTLKDETAQLAAVWFRGDQRGRRLALRDGLQVRVFGRVTVYERGGNYQIVVRRLEEAGRGALQARFEALKAKLQQEGLFDPSRKKPLPLLARHIGVVTSPSGAAIRDILNVLWRRFPNVHVLLAPARVQGEGAAEEIAAAIDLLNARGGLDVLIVGRGGGSLEDLWCFNEEAVARAVARSRIPVISAVGHEIDFTISDFVADLRAPTPSAAAELVVRSKEELTEKLAQTGRRLGRALRETALVRRNRLLALARRLAALAPTRTVARWRERLNALGYRLGRQTEGRLRQAQQRVDELGLRLAHRLELRVRGLRETAARLETQLRALDPLAVLSRGYSLTSDEQGRILRRAADVTPGQRVRTRLAEGAFESQVLGGPEHGNEAKRGQNGRG